MELSLHRAYLQDSEWVLFTDMDEETFTRDFLNSPDKIILSSWNSYDKTQHLLLTIMPKPLAHETASHAFEHMLLTALVPMGLDRKLNCGGTFTRHGEDGGKQPDAQYLPMRLPRGRTADWPAIVLEVAVSESASKLMSDVRYWLRQANGAVQVALTLNINRRTPELTLERWERNDDGGNEPPHRKQSITMRKCAKNHIEISGGPLVVDFEKLFLRKPDIPKERPIRLEAEDLRYIAISIWKVQNFYGDEDEVAEEE